MDMQGVVRPAVADDLPELLRLAGRAGVGLTTLPNNSDLLAERIAASGQALAANVTRPGPESYLFVLEAGGRVLGCSALIAAVGMEQAFYNYHVGRTVFASRELGVYRVVPTLYLSNDLTGASELATLFVDPEARESGAGQLLSLCRFLFVAAHRQRFAERFIAELRGVADAQGRSPFWESLGRHFFAVDFAVADSLSGARTRSFIAELMPRHPVYTVLLSVAGRQVIGEVHEQTRGARRILEKEGFRYRQYVDIFDAGPALEVETDEISSIQDAHRGMARIGEPAQSLAIVANTGLQEFRAIRCVAGVEDGDIVLSSADLQRLSAQTGDELILRPLLN